MSASECGHVQWMSSINWVSMTSCVSIVPPTKGFVGKVSLGVTDPLGTVAIAYSLSRILAKYMYRDTRMLYSSGV